MFTIPLGYIVHIWQVKTSQNTKLLKNATKLSINLKYVYIFFTADVLQYEKNIQLFGET